MKEKQAQGKSFEPDVVTTGRASKGGGDQRQSRGWGGAGKYGKLATAVQCPAKKTVIPWNQRRMDGLDSEGDRTLEKQGRGVSLENG